MKALLRAGLPVSSYPYTGLWFDIGRPDDFQQAVAAWSAVNGVEGVAVEALPEAEASTASI